MSTVGLEGVTIQKPWPLNLKRHAGRVHGTYPFSTGQTLAFEVSGSRICFSYGFWRQQPPKAFGIDPVRSWNKKPRCARRGRDA